MVTQKEASSETVLDTTSPAGERVSPDYDPADENYEDAIVDDSADVEGEPESPVEDGAEETTESGAEETEPAPETGAEDSSEETTSSAWAEMPETKQAQSKWDSRIADLEKRVEEAESRANETVVSQAEQAEITQAQQEAVVERDRRASAYMDQGFTQEQATNAANREVTALYQAWEVTRVAKKEVEQARQVRSQTDAEILQTTKLQIAAEHGVQPSELDEFQTPTQMKKYAEAVSKARPAKRAPRPGTNGAVSGDTAPTNIEALVDQYNNGADLSDAQLQRVNEFLDAN